MTIVVPLPRQFRVASIYSFSKNFVGSDGTPSDTSFTLDFGDITFIDGFGYTVLSNTIGWLQSHGVAINYANFYGSESPAIDYLDDCGFFREHLGGCLSADRQRRSTTIPCTAIAHANAHGWLEYQLSPWLGDVLHVTHGALGSVRTCVKELFNNISDHAAVNTGFVHVQHYPQIHRVAITVSDFGRGIPSTIRERFGEMPDPAAIALAATEGFSAKSKPNNMGAGLNYLIDSVMANHGTVRIYSLSGSLNCSRDNSGAGGRVPRSGNGSYPGTLVDIGLDTRLFVGDEDDRVDVEW